MREQMVEERLRSGRRPIASASSTSGRSATTRSPSRRSSRAASRAAMRPAVAARPARGAGRRAPARDDDGPPPGRAAYLRIRELTKRFGAFTALDGISLDIHEGEFVCFLGPLRLRQDHAAARHRRPRHPDERAASSRPGATSPRCRPAERDFGIVFQSYALFPNLTVGEERRLRARERAGMPRAEVRARVRELLDLVGLPEQGRQVPGPALRRPAAARRAGARARHRRPASCCSTSRCPRSTPRCASTCAHEIRAAAAPARRHHDHGHARPGGGADHGRPHRGDEPGRDRAGRHAARGLPAPGLGLRRRLHRRR